MNTGKMMTGIGMGVALGSVALFAGSKMMDKSTLKSTKKTAAKCVKNLNSMLDSVQTMLK